MNVCRKIRIHYPHRFSIAQKLYSMDEKHDKSPAEGTRKVLCCPESEKKLSVGILGGGMTPIFTASLLKQSKLLRSINVVDVSNCLSGAVFDAGHIDTKPKIKYYRKSSLEEALSNVDIIALMDDNDDGRTLSAEPKLQFMMSSNYVRDMANKISKINPSALLAIFVHPVTATLPLVSEIFSRKMCWDPSRILGSVALDAMRIESMAANLFHLNPAFLSIPVVGGADTSTSVPLLTTAKPLNYMSQEHEKLLVNQLRSCDKELENCADDYTGPAMSSGAAAARFLITLARALAGEPNVKCSAYVRSNIVPFCRYFANEIELGTTGVTSNYGLPKVSSLALNLIQRAIPIITELSDMACDSFESPEALEMCKDISN